MRGILNLVIFLIVVVSLWQATSDYRSNKDINKLNKELSHLNMGNNQPKKENANKISQPEQQNNISNAQLNTEKVCPNGRKYVNGNCRRNIYKCVSWESEHVCKVCEKGYHLEWYGNIAKICYPDFDTAKAVCASKKPKCPFINPSGWANDADRGIPWVDCGDDADNVWWFIYQDGEWVPNGKKGNPICE